MKSQINIKNISDIDFDLNRTTLKSLLDGQSLDLLFIKDVSNEVSSLVIKENIITDSTIITGSYASYLANIVSSYRDIDVFCMRDIRKLYTYDKIKSNIVEYIIKNNWRSAISNKIFSDNQSISDDINKEIQIFASLIIHLFDLDVNRFVCIPDMYGKWSLYTCSAGQRFLQTKINYVDRYNARSIKVHARIQKYKEKGIESIYQNPDIINATTIYGNTDTSKIYENVIQDNRDIMWFLYHQHGIYPPIYQYSNKILYQIQGILSKYKLNKLIYQLHYEYNLQNILEEKIFEGDTSIWNKSYSNKFFTKDKMKGILPIVHKDLIYWFRIERHKTGIKFDELEDTGDIYYDVSQYTTIDFLTIQSRESYYKFYENLISYVNSDMDIRPIVEKSILAEVSNSYIGWIYKRAIMNKERDILYEKWKISRELDEDIEEYESMKEEAELFG